MCVAVLLRVISCLFRRDVRCPAFTCGVLRFADPRAGSDMRRRALTCLFDTQAFSCIRRAPACDLLDAAASIGALSTAYLEGGVSLTAQSIRVLLCRCR